MKKYLITLLIIPLFLLTSFIQAQANDKIMWGKTELKPGQIGKITILKPINLWKNVGKDNLVVARTLNPKEEYRVYGYREEQGGQYNVGGGNWVTKISTHVKYETPSKHKISLLTNKDTVKNETAKATIWDSNRLIAHAMGAIEGKTYSNSLEAFEYNYKLGYRVFEVDFSLTSDNVLVARHDWRLSLSQTYEQESPTSDDSPWTYNYFMNQKIYKKYSSLDINGIIGLLRKYDDIYIVTDTKYDKSDLVKQHFELIVESANFDKSILDRIIPQIYKQPMLSDIKGVYDFPEFIYTLYSSGDTDQQVVNFVTENKIKAVAMPDWRVKEDFVRELNNSKVYTFIHTINNKQTAKKYNDIGFYGFYSDLLVKQDLKDFK